MAIDSERSKSLTRATPLRRIGAFCVDYVVCGCYAGALFGVVLLANGGRVPQREIGPVEGQSIGLLSLTIPVLLYFAICESSCWQATLGKRLLGLCVQDTAGNQLPFRKTLLRAFLKFLPWELSHTFVHQLVSGAAHGEANHVPLWAWSLLTVSILIDASYLISLWSRNGRTVYDRLLATQVVVSPC